MNKFHWLVRAVVRPVLHPFLPLEVKGAENLPREGAMICPNHCSNWDPVFVFISMPKDYNVRTMAKESLFHIPVLGWIIKKLGGFPVARGDSDIHAIKTAIQTLKNGENLMLFPEGQRVKQEGEVAAKGGAAMIAIRTGATLVPVYVEQEKRLFHRHRIIFGEPYKPSFTGRRGTSEEVQAIADDLLRRAYDLGREG